MVEPPEPFASFAPFAPMAGALIEAGGLTLTGGPRTLVSALDWRAAPGEFWCVLGANGAGKSSLLAALAGLHQAVRGGLNHPSKASVRWRGMTPGSPDARALARLRSYMPQDVQDAFSATVLATVLLGRYPHRQGLGWESEDDVAMAQAALERVDLAGFGQRDVRSLSGGERQRVALAMLLAQDAPLMLLDEPTSHQDPGHQMHVGTLLAELARTGRVVVAALHDVNQALRFATHALILLPGGTVAQGDVRSTLTESALQQAYGHPFKRVADGESNWMLPA